MSVRPCPQAVAVRIVRLRPAASSVWTGQPARVEAASLPLDPLLASAGISGDETLSLALDGGEDFELLFTVSERDARRLPDELGGVRVTHVGEVTRERGKVRLVHNGRARLLRPGGFEHFARGDK